jgi:catechol 2,3-dioxygenase
MLTSIHPDTKIGTVALTISDLDRELAFYQDVLGFQVHRRAGDTAYLGAGGPNLLVLTQHPGAELVSGTTGLHHFAILLTTSAREIARTRLADQKEEGGNIS